MTKKEAPVDWAESGGTERKMKVTMVPEENAGIEVTDTYDTLPVKLTDEGYKEYGLKMAQANREIAAAEDELAAVKSQFKSRIDAAVAKRNEYAGIINAGAVYQKVDCQLIKDFVHNTITLVRTDTDEVVRTRTMSMDERQRKLPGTKE